MNAYEALYIITPEFEEEAVKTCIAKYAGIVEANSGEVEKTDEWGKTRLAYPIDYKTEGYYVLMLFNGPPELPRELERNLKNDENIIRFMVTRRDS